MTANIKAAQDLLKGDTAADCLAGQRTTEASKVAHSKPGSPVTPAGSPQMQTMKMPGITSSPKRSIIPSFVHRQNFHTIKCTTTTTTTNLAGALLARVVRVQEALHVAEDASLVQTEVAAWAAVPRKGGRVTARGGGAPSGLAVHLPALGTGT